MRDTYAEATAVLVLDSWLLSNTCSEEKGSDTEVLVRIFNSTWNSPLWTCQEGALAKSLFLQPKDAPHNPEEGTARLQAQSDDDFSLSFNLTPPLNLRCESLKGFMAGKTQEERMLAVFEGLKFRSTSMITDETLCLSTLLGLDVNTIIKAGSKASQRMSEFWRMLKRIPFEVLRFERETFEESGLRWALRPLLYVESNRLGATGAYKGFEGRIGELRCRIRTPKGFCVRSHGYIFDTGGHRLRSDILMRD